VTFLRRTLDVTVSVVALAGLAPLLPLIALGIKLGSPGPVLYHQVRVGLDRRGEPRRAPRPAPGPGDRRESERRVRATHGRPFRIYKFRTMVLNAEEYGPQWSRKRDPRIFPFGRFLRLTRLDETPQFLNVLRGDMSLIGPRPERPFFVEQFVETIPEYRERLRVRPGITGRAQVSLDYDSSVDDVKRKLEQDLLYIRERSLAQDLSILARTVWVVLTGRGAC
jgi:lipopolysaccharide/colanic/teichoic acid biosynthesis glycosyltransferase